MSNFRTVHLHYFQAQNVRIPIETRDKPYRLRHVIHMHGRLHLLASVRLNTARLHVVAHRGRGVSDIELSGRDVVFPSVERGRSGETVDGMFGYRVGGVVWTYEAGRFNIRVCLE